MQIHIEKKKTDNLDKQEILLDTRKNMKNANNIICYSTDLIIHISKTVENLNNILV